MKEILTYKTSTGKCPFDDWFYKLDKTNQARIEKNLSGSKKAIMGISKN